MKLDNIYKKLSDIEFQYNEENYENVEKYLEKYYPEIKKAIDDENYVIEYPMYDFFVELKYEDKIAGFYTLEWGDETCDKLINEFYVMPKYRGNNLFTETMKLLFIQPNDNYILRNPTRLLIEILIKNGLAIKISENIVITHTTMADNSNKYYSNKNIEKLYNKKNNTDVYITSKIYDIKSSSIISIDEDKVISKNKNNLFMLTPRKQDIDKYELKNILNNVTPDYLSAIKRIIDDSDDIILNSFENSSDELLDILTVDHIFGSEKNLHEDMIELIENTEYTKEEIINAINKVDIALKELEITPFSLITRFDYLLDYPHMNATLTGDEELIEDECPYCQLPRKFSDISCDNCGFNFFEYDPISNDENFKKIIDNLSIDTQTGLQEIFLEEILEKGYDPKEIYEEQFELAVNSFLMKIDEDPTYKMMPLFEDDYHVSEDDVITYLKTNKLVEEKINKNYDEDFINIKPYEIEYNIIDKYIYKITKKGRRHYKKNKICSSFIKFFNQMEYHEFKDFCENNTGKKMKEINEDYFNTKLNESIRNNDRYMYVQMCECEENLAQNNDSKLWKAILKLYICRANDNFLEFGISEDGLNDLNAVKILFILESCTNKELKELYDNVYNNIELDELRIRKKENWENIEKFIYEEIPRFKEYSEY